MFYVIRMRRIGRPLLWPRRCYSPRTHP
jgi:hypothetical protein